MKINQLLNAKELKVVHKYLPNLDLTVDLTDDGLADFEEQLDNAYINHEFTNEEINDIGRQLEPIVDKLAES
ncbi:hypothetical protein YK48G_26730 [Lentilactobacillus fungorum]|uniref:Uncharacterized protein n=1 Tax=Lentilactobacillus fungorum TaxID=2201250 RepID=A0ABQ3W4D6_9LACO|nr:hypothetical protein [Lentilactobacillus fungorum]GHP15248.1 hypothetical protein YK48G_26730 [Lentilactobacillus fungorum]